MPNDPADAITPDQIDHTYRTLIRPTIFANAPGGETKPTLILLGGQAGSGKTRASARLLTEHDGMIALSGDDLRIFHPNYRELITDQPEQAGAILAETTRPWVRAVLRDCLDERRSLLLEGSFGDPDATLTTASRFRDAGFDVRIVAIASPRVLSVVTATSRFLRDLKAGAPPRFTRLSAHDHGYNGTTRLVDSLNSALPIHGVTILRRNGIVLYDERRDAQGGPLPAGAREALEDGRHPSSWGARSTMELLGELKQITDFAINSGHLTADLIDLLDEAHKLALEDVVPRLSIDADSSQAKFIRQAVTEQSVALRRSRLETKPADATGVVQPVADVDEIAL